MFINIFVEAEYLYCAQKYHDRETQLSEDLSSGVWCPEKVDFNFIKRFLGLEAKTLPRGHDGDSFLVYAIGVNGSQNYHSIDVGSFTWIVATKRYQSYINNK